MAAGISPLDVMLDTMRERWDAGDKAGACAIAKDAAPYVHPRLASTHVKGELSVTDALAERLARARERIGA